MKTTNPMGSTTAAPLVAEIDGVLTAVTCGMRPPALGTDLTLHGLPEHPQGLQLRVVRIQEPAIDVAGWVCHRCAVFAECKPMGIPTALSLLCSAGTDIALARPEDIPAMTLRGDLA